MGIIEIKMSCFNERNDEIYHSKNAIFGNAVRGHDAERLRLKMNDINENLNLYRSGWYKCLFVGNYSGIKSRLLSNVKLLNYQDNVHLRSSLIHLIIGAGCYEDVESTTNESLKEKFGHHFASFRLLIKLGVNIHLKDAYGNTALNYCMKSRKPILFKMAQILIKN